MFHAAHQLLGSYRADRDRRRLRAHLPDIASAFERPGTTEERTSWAPIEQRRAVLLASDQLIPFPDYGAGPLSPQAGSGTRRVGDLTRVASKPRRWTEVLFHLVRIIQPRVAVELGTCVGISGAYQASALKLNGDGMLLTFEGVAAAARIAENGFRELGLERHARVIIGRFEETLVEVLRGTEPIAYAFIDGHHEEHATVQYYRTLSPHLERRALIVFDDIRWSEGMTRAWGTICADAGVQVAIDCGPVGICLRDPAVRAGRYRISFV